MDKLIFTKHSQEKKMPTTGNIYQESYGHFIPMKNFCALAKINIRNRGKIIGYWHSNGIPTMCM